MDEKRTQPVACKELQEYGQQKARLVKCVEAVERHAHGRGCEEGNCGADLWRCRLDHSIVAK